MQLEVSDLFFSYDETDVLKSVSFCADRGERIAVLGPNGVGKSTLFRCLLGFLEPKRGSVKIAGRDVRDYSRRALAAELAYIPQSYSPAFDHTVLGSLGRLTAPLGSRRTQRSGFWTSLASARWLRAGVCASPAANGS